jgi:hypothetical protein
MEEAAAAAAVIFPTLNGCKSKAQLSAKIREDPLVGIVTMVTGIRKKIAYAGPYTL